MFLEEKFPDGQDSTDSTEERVCSGRRRSTSVWRLNGTERLWQQDSDSSLDSCRGKQSGIVFIEMVSWLPVLDQTAVLFTDESRFNMSHNDARVCV